MDDGAEAVVRAIAGCVREAAANGGLSLEDVEGIGVGSPGPLDPYEGVIISPENMPCMHGVRLRELLEEDLSRPVRVDNDANMAAFGEQWLGAGRGVDHFLCVTLGTGVGGGWVSEGCLMRGFNGNAAEVGHVTVDHAGPRCACHNYGCLEMYASATAMVRRTAERIEETQPDTSLDVNGLTTRAMFDVAEAGDAFAQAMFEETGTFLGDRDRDTGERDERRDGGVGGRPGCSRGSYLRADEAHIHGSGHGWRSRARANCSRRPRRRRGVVGGCAFGYGRSDTKSRSHEGPGVGATSGRDPNSEMPRKTIAVTSPRSQALPGNALRHVATRLLVTSVFLSLVSPTYSAEPDSTRQAVPKSPSGAALRSLTLPGWGQFYNGKKIKGTILAAAEMGSVAAYFVRRDQLKDEFVLPGGRGSRNGFVFVIAGVIFYNVVDAFVDAHLDVVDWGELSVGQSSRGDPRLGISFRF